MSDFVVHSIPGSPFGRAVLATLAEKSAPYRFRAVNPQARHEEPYRSLNAFGRVPTFEHGDFVLYETQAILRHLERILPAPPLTPSDPRQAARMDQIMGICDWYLYQGVNSVIGFHRLVGPRLLGLAPDEAAIAAAMPRAHRVFAELSRLLGAQPYLTGIAASLADLMVAAQMDFLAQTPEWTPLTQERANLVGWLERMNGRPSMQVTSWERVVALARAT